MKEKKDILIVTGSFEPTQSPRSFRSTELAKEFARQGHFVKVITPGYFAEHEDIKREYGIRFKYLGYYRHCEIELPRNIYSQLFVRIKRRSLNWLFEYPDVLLVHRVIDALEGENNYDLLVSIAVPFPIHWGVALAWKKKKKNSNPARIWVADCGDPYMYSKHDSFPKLPYFHILENLFLARADYISVPFYEMKHMFNKKYIEKFIVIPQGFKFSNLNFQDYKPNPVPTFIYAGVVMPRARDPFSLIDMLLEENYNFKFIVYTKQVHLFNQYSDILNKNLFVNNFIPRDQLLQELSRADFLLNVNTDKVDNTINAIPTKLIDYKLSGRPILSYEQSKLPKEVVRLFMQGDYTFSYDDPNFERYRIENVVEKFLGLIP